MIGLWKTQVIVDCSKCQKPMGWHQVTTTACCNTCKSLAPIQAHTTEYGNICIDHTRTDTRTHTRTDKGATT